MSGALSKQQADNARFIYQRALQRGLSAGRAKELASAAYAESGLDPTNYNGRSAGKKFVPGKTAGGDFQLLSSGYVNQAQAHGGVLDPAANFDAIEPAYARYWQQHPNASPGEAAAAVEASGEGAGFYSKGLDMLGFLGGPGGSSPSSPAASLGSSLIAPTQDGPDPRRQFALSIASEIGKHRDPNALLQALQTLRTGLAGQQQPSNGAYGAPVQPQTPSQPAAAPYKGPVAIEGDTSGEQQSFIAAVEQAVKAAGGDAIRMTSGYRDPAHNKAVGGVQGSLHTQGKAMDGYAHINGQWVPLGTALRALAARYGLRSGDQPGFFNGKPDPVHVDYGYGR